jgi:hypothetical protein
MKNQKVLFIISAVLVALTIEAQSIDSSSAWRVNSSVCDPGHEIHYGFYKDYIDGDTTINGKDYLKIYQSGYTKIDWIPNPSYNYFTHVFHGLLREENHRWYTFLENRDQLLFDFTLEVGDTVHSACTFLLNQTIIVDTIDSVMVGQSYKRRLHLNNEYGANYLIEGIGASSGLFEQMIFFEWESGLVCFAQNGVSVWGSSSAECNLNIGIEENPKNHEVVRVFPNPATDFTYVAIPPNITGANISLTDVYGRIIFNRSNFSGTVLQLPLSSAPPGFYSILVRSGFKIQALKLLIK